MNWVKDYEDDLVALEEARGDILLDILPVDLNDEEQIRNFLEEFIPLFAPLADGSLDPGDVDTILKLWWQRFKASEIAALKKEVPVLYRLAPLFEKLGHASDAEWEEYAQIRLWARFQTQAMQPWLLQMSSRLQMLADMEVESILSQPHEDA